MDEKELDGLARLEQLNQKKADLYIERSNPIQKEQNKIKRENNKVAIKIDTIKLSNFRFFTDLETDDEDYNLFKPNGQNMLIYGENGSGKSSLYKAFEFLATPSINQEKFEATKNIFKENREVSLTFEFDNEETLTLSSDALTLGNDYDYVKNLSVFMPMLDYKKLFEVSHTKSGNEKKKNLYSFFEIILENYPIKIKDKKILN